jgi:hypothetical protein
MKKLAAAAAHTVAIGVPPGVFTPLFELSSRADDLRKKR